MIVVKAGGGAGLNWDGLAADLAVAAAFKPIVLVHGAHSGRDALAEALGRPVRTVTSPSGVDSVYTDEQALDIMLMAYAGAANKRAVASLQARGLNAVGLCGIDGRLWEARAKKDILVRENDKVKLLRGNLTGRVERINTGLLRLLLEGGYVPVITAPAISAGREIVNADADTAAALTALGLGAEALVFLFEAPGLLRDPDRPETLVREVSRGELDGAAAFARGRMAKKMMGVRKALEGGVRAVYFGDGRDAHPLSSALAGNGTVFR